MAQAFGNWHRAVRSRQLHDPQPMDPKTQLVCGIVTSRNHEFNQYKVEVFRYLL